MTKSKFGKPLCRSIMAVAIMLLSLQAMAYDFSYTHQGKTLYYKILAGGTNTLAVTYYSGTPALNNHVSGDVVIPSSVEHNNVTYSVTSIGDSAFFDCSGLTSLTIPNNVTSIGNYAFYRCSGLTSVSIPNSVTSIGEIAFAYCSGLTSVIIPNGVTSIKISLFYDCSSLTSVTIPNGVISIGGSAFQGCSSLTSITIPNGVTSIGNYAFYRCSSLTSVTIPNSVGNIGYAAFHNCRSLNSINVASGNGYFSSIDGVLYDNPRETLIQCPGARTSLTIPNSVTTIGERAFIYCRDLTSVTIPNSVTSIGGGAFYSCNSLTSIKCLAAVPPSLDTINLFFNIPDTCTLTVPCGSLEAYTTSDWNTYFATRISEDLSFELSVSANEEAYGSVEVETQSCNVKTLTAIANNGYVFSRWSDGNMENPRTVSITSDTAFMAIFTASGSSSLQAVSAREFAIYPNPAKNFVTLEFETLEENTLLQILDINGRRVRTFDLKAGVETLRIDVSDLPKGVYTIMLGNTTKKLIVE